MSHPVPQPSPERMVPVSGHPLVLALEPDQPELVALTAAEWARAAGASALYCAYVDQARYVAQEYPDGTVLHAPIDPDGLDDAWQARERTYVAHLESVLADAGLPWEFRYLAGRPDRALTHLARAVDAAGFVVGTRAPGPGARVREFVDGSVAVRLTHHQHRPVLIVPLEVIDWRASHWS
ncbi:universal stress protein [Isoptericola sp. b441]|uniref:Universal stress protein n=1 Tax=Actinotalea lenta TaxID=3064654 RepID=A0ABT9D934_9CELL|nr:MULTISPECIES: universal stress protein [unclassified Isoptericola]MDO8106764.1 universal stress protein [Isoptericola sp. b441]MDO8121524.1 universal stress protein [Isoptericola sp. b490]